MPQSKTQIGRTDQQRKSNNMHGARSTLNWKRCRLKFNRGEATFCAMGTWKKAGGAALISDKVDFNLRLIRRSKLK